MSHAFACHIFVLLLLQNYAAFKISQSVAFIRYKT